MIKSIEHLKSRFTRGAKPTESDFFDIFDSFVHKELFENLLSAVENGETFNVEIKKSDGTTFVVSVSKLN
jgi:hypothetical protein